MVNMSRVMWRSFLNVVRMEELRYMEYFAINIYFFWSLLFVCNAIYYIYHDAACCIPSVPITFCSHAFFYLGTLFVCLLLKLSNFNSLCQQVFPCHLVILVSLSPEFEFGVQELRVGVSHSCGMLNVTSSFPHSL